MPDSSLPLLVLGPEQIRLRKRELMRRRLLHRRLPLLAWESLLQRLAGLMLQHPQQAGFVRKLTDRASDIRLQGDMELARELEADYLAHLTARGIRETWYDAVGDEARLLDQHYRAVGTAQEREGESPSPGHRQRLFLLPSRQ